MGKGLCSMFSYTLNSRCAAATQISVCDGLSCCSLPSPVCIQWNRPYSFSLWKGYWIAKEKLQPSTTGCPEEERIGLFVCVFLSQCIVGTSHPKGSLVKFQVGTQQGNACHISGSCCCKVRESKTTLVPEVTRIVICPPTQVTLTF